MSQRKLCVFSLAVLMLTSGAALAGNGRGLSRDQIARLHALPAVDQLNVDSSGTPTLISGRLGFLGFGPVEHAVHGFMANQLPLFQGGGEERFRTLRVHRDAAGLAHLRLEQTYRGLPIVGAELIVHVKEVTGEVTGINGRFVPAVGLAVAPGLDSGVAMQRALGAAGIAAASQLLEKPYLTYVLDDAGTPRLAWAARVAYRDEQGMEEDRVFADAGDGTLVAKHGLIWRAKYRQIYDAGHGTSLPGSLMFQEGGSSSDVNAQKAYDYTGNTYDYYSSQHGRDSWNGSGGNLISTVHYSVSYNNAFWTSSGNQLVFGDGDGSQFSGLAQGLDIVAHEVTHGVTQATANLTYANESGALNEAMSDIFGASTEAYIRGLGSNTWKIGEDVYTPGTSGDALRYMNNPTQDGSSKDYYPERQVGGGDNGGVHSNSGIANLAFYLLSQGGSHPRGKTSITVPSIGQSTAESIFYRALSTYMGSSDTFQAARDNTAKAATDFYGPCGSQVAAVHNAWDAVGVPRTPGTDIEPNDSPSESVNIPGSSGATIGYLCTSGNADWYSVTKNNSYSGLQITLYPPANSDYDMDLWSSAGQRSASYNTGNGVSESMTWYYDAGTYYIRVFGKNNAYNTSSSYSLYFYQ